MVRDNVRALRQRRKLAANSKADCELEAGAETNQRCNLGQVPQPNLLLTPGSNRINIGCELLSNSLEWKLHLPFRLSASPSSEDAFIAAFRHYCRPPQSSGDLQGDRVHIVICCGSWVESTCMQTTRYKESLISQALSASAFAVVGTVRQDAAMLRVAERAQSSVLSALRSLIQKIRADCDARILHCTSVALLTCAITDLLINKSWTTFGVHLKGVGALIEFAGSGAMNEPRAFENFQGYRAAQFAFSFMERQASFLSRPPWMNLPAPPGHAPLEVRTWRLLDILYEVPNIMQAVDRSSAPRGHENDEDINNLHAVWEQITEVNGQLTSWETDFESDLKYSPLGLSLPPSDKPWEQERVFANNYAAKFCAWISGARITLYEMASSVSKSLPMGRGRKPRFPFQDYVGLTYQSAVIACQCLNHLSKAQAKISGKLYCLFCLDMTWKAMKTLNDSHGVSCAEELRWCEKIAVNLGKIGLPIIRSH